jgi:hypothetical protein
MDAEVSRSVPPATPNGSRREAVRQLQTDLRALGYLRAGIDAALGPATQSAIAALQWDLLHNDGQSAKSDGPAPLAIRDYNRGKLTSVTGEYDAPTAECVAAMKADDRFFKLPDTADARGANARIPDAIAALDDARVPPPFLRAIAQQESECRHWHEPAGEDTDTFVTVGLDTNDRACPFRITSRGFGAVQPTLFHHPPRPEEIRAIADLAANLRIGASALRAKFENFVVSASPSARADDRLAEIGASPLRACRYEGGDPRYMKDCANCARRVDTLDILPGRTSLYPNAGLVYEPTSYYRRADYSQVPNRANFGCDWPYAVRRYNGSGVNSYLYQVKVLKYLAALPPPTTIA